jgi:hypothetical protein
MNRERRMCASILGGLMLLGGVACTCGQFVVPLVPRDPVCVEAPYSNPPPELQNGDLVGTWATGYDGATDQLIISPDGTFKQVYEERIALIVRLHRFETPWNPWWVERFRDGRVRVHFEGARYYPRGSGIGELHGMGYGPDPLPWLFRDPFAKEYVEMVDKLVLNVRVDSGGELLLHHMFYHSDEGFAISGCQSDYFRRVDTP